jgi:hypothetical protein
LDSFTLTSAIGVTPAQIVLDWTGIGAVYFVDSAAGTCFRRHHL